MSNKNEMEQHSSGLVFFSLNLNSKKMDSLFFSGKDLFTEEKSNLIDFKTIMELFFYNISLSNKDFDDFKIQNLLDKYKTGINSYTKELCANDKSSNLPIFLGIECFVADEIRGLKANFYISDITVNMMQKCVLEKVMDFRYEVAAFIFPETEQMVFLHNVYTDEYGLKDGAINTILETFIGRWIIWEQRDYLQQDLSLEMILSKLEEQEIYIYEIVMIMSDGEMRKKQFLFTYANREEKVIVMLTMDIQTVSIEAMEREREMENLLGKVKNATDIKDNLIERLDKEICVPVNNILNTTALLRNTIKDSPEIIQYIDQIESYGRQIINFSDTVSNIKNPIKENTEKLNS